MMNFANNINVYNIYAQMAMDNTVKYETDRPYSALYVGRRDGLTYKNNVSDVYSKYGKHICIHDRMAELLAEAMGNECYVARFDSSDECKEFIRYVLEKPEEKPE